MTGGMKQVRSGMDERAGEWIAVNGAKLRVDRRPGNGGTIVLLHEMGGTLESYDGLLARLDKRWSVLRYDQRGAGLSDTVAAPLSIDTPAADLAALLDKLRITHPVVVVGAAVGAAIAVRFAALYPTRVHALVLLAPATGVAPERRAATIEKIEKLEASGAPVACGGAIRLDRTSYGATWRMLLALDLEPDFARIACPTLVVAGAGDTYRPPDLVAAIARKITGARFDILDSGHVMAADTPALVAARFTAFLDETGFR